MRRVAVVGAGWAGLAAAVELAQAGCAVDVFEAARHAGGRARSVSIDGKLLDNGQHILLGAYRETLRLIRLCGGDPERLLLRMPLEIVYPGRFHMAATSRLPAPLHLLAGLMAASGIPARDKLSALRMMTSLALRHFTVDPDVSVDAMLTSHRQSRHLRQFLWEPLCIAALNTDPGVASAQVFAHVLSDAFMHLRSDSDFLIPKVDLAGVFPDIACTYIEAHGGSVRFGDAVKAIETRATGTSLVSASATHDYRQVICAIPPARVAMILPAGEPHGACLVRQLAAFEYEPIVTCYLQYAAPIRLERPMIGMAGPVGQWAFDRGALGGSAGLVAIVVSAAARLRGLDTESLARTLDSELRALLPTLPALQWHRVITEKRATFRCVPALARPDVQAHLPGVYLAGDHMVGRYPATLEAAVRSGVAAAGAVLAEPATD